MEALPVETERLLKQNFVLHRPLVWKRREVWQVGQRLLNVVFMPEEHAQSLRTHTQVGLSDFSIKLNNRLDKQPKSLVCTSVVMCGVLLCSWGEMGGASRP